MARGKATRETLPERLRQTEEALRECQAEARAVWDLSGIGQALVDPASERFVRVNGALCRILGYTEAELLRLTVRDVSHPDEADIFTGVLPDMLTGQLAEYAIEKRYLHKEGHVIWVSVHAAALPARPGQPRRTIGIISDITPRKNAEAAALESLTRFRAIFENSVDAIAVYRGITHAMVNPAYLRLFGYNSPEELIGKPGPDLIAPSQREIIAGNIQRRMHGEPVPADYVSRGLRKDGSEFDLEIHASHFDLHGERFRLVILRDVTEPRRIASELEAAHRHLERRVRERTRALIRESRRRERLERQMHEITEREQRRIGQDLHDGVGQHLAGTAFMLGALARTTGKGARVPAEKLLEIAGLLGDAVRQTREISRGLFPADLEEHGLCHALRQLAERTAGTWGIPCQFACAREFRLEKQAAIQLYRVAQEAVANAVKHARPARIALELTATRDAVRLLITDDGRGFDARRRSSGIGLATMKNRVRLLAGQFQIRQNPEGGTAVTCTIPRTTAKRASSRPPRR